MKVIENGKYRDMTEEEVAQQVDIVEDKQEPTVAELLGKIAELEAKLSNI